MSEQVQVKRSATPGEVPTSTDLLHGQWGINTADGKAYIRKEDDSMAMLESLPSKSGNAGKTLQVNGAGTGLEWGAAIAVFATALHGGGASGPATGWTLHGGVP